MIDCCKCRLEKLLFKANNTDLRQTTNLAPSARRFESHDMKSIINLSNQVTQTLTHKYVNIFMEESQGLHDLKKLKYAGCIFNCVVVKSSKQTQNLQITLSFHQLGQFPQFFLRYS